VTGAEGCIGAWVTKILLERGVEVIAFDVTETRSRLRLIAPSLDQTRLRYELGRLEDTARVKALVNDHGITHIVHLAAVLMPFCQAKPVEGALINVIGTLNVFEAVRDVNPNIRISYASSSAVWGPEDAYDDRALTERDAPLPSTHYGIYKLANESSARVFYQQHQISSFALRPWTVYGPGRDAGLTAAPTLALQHVARGERYQLPVSGPMDLQFVEDVAGAFVACLFAPQPGAHVFNLAGDVVDMQDFIRLVEQIRPEAQGLLTAAGPRVPVAHRMDASLLHQSIPELPRTSLADGIGRTIATYIAADERHRPA
jgi:nucleoside-diphosphate-sugar epimerase